MNIVTTDVLWPVDGREGCPVATICANYAIIVQANRKGCSFLTYIGENFWLEIVWIQTLVNLMNCTFELKMKSIDDIATVRILV